jgi:hypothetical protein
MPIPEIPRLPTAPSRNRPTDFADEADTFLSALPDFGDNCNTLAGFCEVQATTAETIKDETSDIKDDTNAIKDLAYDAQVAAEAARDAAQSISDYKGEWSSLTGSLPIPASVYHDGSYWLLINSLADVTLSEPSESNSDWSPVYSGRYDYDIYATNFTAQTGSQYIVEAASGDRTITMPASPSTNDWIEVKTYLSNEYYVYINPGSEKIESLAEIMKIDVDISFRLVYLNSSRGWVLI